MKKDKDMNENKKMKKNKLIIFLTGIFLTIFLFVTLGSAKAEPIEKNETVYVILNHDGSVKDERVVNWIYGAGGGKTWTDYGSYSEILNMTSDLKPVTETDSVIWPATALEAGNFYYQGITDKELPVEISIKYYLDGREVSGDSLAGKSGKLKIIFKVENKLKGKESVVYTDYYGSLQNNYKEYYTPFLVQISVKANLNLFTEIKAPDAKKVVTGEEMNISFGSYPFPDEEFIIEMKGENIELDPINITIIPSEIIFPDTSDTEEGLTDMADGVSDMEDGTNDILEGLDKMISKSGDLQKGSSDLADAIAEINHGVYSLNSNSQDISDGFIQLLSGTKKFQDGSAVLVIGMTDIREGSGAIEQALNDSASGLSVISSNTAGLSSGMSDILTNHDNLVNIAQALVNSDPSNETYQQLLALASGEQMALSGITSGLQGINYGISELSGGLNILSREYSAFNEGINKLAGGANELPAGLKQLYDGQKQLYDGWDQYSDAISKLYDGTRELCDETRDFPENINKFVNGIKDIRKGLNKLNKDGILELKEGIIENINTLKEGLALKDKINESAVKYNSFMDNNRNVKSSVQFLMKTEEIKIREPEPKIEENIAENNPGQSSSLWQKIISFFKKGN